MRISFPKTKKVWKECSLPFWTSFHNIAKLWKMPRWGMYDLYGYLSVIFMTLVRSFVAITVLLCVFKEHWNLYGCIFASIRCRKTGLYHCCLKWGQFLYLELCAHPPCLQKRWGHSRLWFHCKLCVARSGQQHRSSHSIYVCARKPKLISPGAGLLWSFRLYLHFKAASTRWAWS